MIKIGIVLGSLVLLVCVVFVVLMVLVLGMDFTKTIKHSQGWVYQDNHGTAVKEFQKEENGCVYFVDVWDKANKVCGVYQIKKF